MASDLTREQITTPSPESHGLFVNLIPQALTEEVHVKAFSISRATGSGGPLSFAPT